jgi:hypothetical protein
VCYAHDSQRVAIRLQERWNDRDPLTGLGQREQGVRRAALEQNVGLDVCETASCVEQPPNRVTGLEQKQRITCEVADIDHSGVAKLERWGARGQNLVRRSARLSKRRPVSCSCLMPM